MSKKCADTLTQTRNYCNPSSVYMYVRINNNNNNTLLLLRYKPILI